MKQPFGLFLLIFFTSCSFSKLASNLTSDILQTGAPVFEEESDIEVAEQSSLAMLKTLEAFQRHNPKNKTYLKLLSKSYGTYAFGFLENRLIQYQGKNPERYETTLQRAKLFYSRGKKFGMMLLESENKDLYKSLEQGLGPLKKELAKVGRDEAEAVFWTALSWGNYINLTKDEVRSVSDLAIVEAMMGRVLEVRPDFFYGGPHLFYGVFYASRPPMLGGNPDEAKKHFEAAIKVTEGKLLLTQVLEAQFLAVQTQDKALFESLLAQVEAASIEALPEQRLANVLAKERAKFLRENEKNYF